MIPSGIVLGSIKRDEKSLKWILANQLGILKESTHIIHLFICQFSTSEIKCILFYNYFRHSLVMSDILELESDESEMHFLYDHLRPIWIPGGMVCHVPECPRTDKLSTLRAFVRHWKFIHVRTITLYVCGHLDCLEVPVFKAKNELHRHIQYKHKLSVEEARTLAATYPTRKEVNSRFVDPRENLPPRRLSPTSEMARQTNRLRRHQQIGALPDLEGKGIEPHNAVCRDEFVTFDTDGNVTGKKYRRRQHLKVK